MNSDLVYYIAGAGFGFLAIGFLGILIGDIVSGYRKKKEELASEIVASELKLLESVKNTGELDDVFDTMLEESSKSFHHETKAQKVKIIGSMLNVYPNRKVLEKFSEIKTGRLPKADKAAG
ncbi:MAG: hypothetical protein KI791_03080 [Cyclobacteriaceae bacterium]|nr:hypothetical protein [Cyclobacteriaceae bacterium SS2]